MDVEFTHKPIKSGMDPGFVIHDGILPLIGRLRESGTFWSSV